MRKVLVTGADGFIGSHLAEALVKKNYNVTAMVQYNSFGKWGWLEQSDPSVVSCMEVVLGDVRDGHFVKEVMRGCDYVIHLAALIAIPYSYVAPAAYVETNVTGTLNVLQAARELSVKRLIHTSTSEVYGSAQYVPITENHPIVGQSPYSASKIAADQLAYSYYTSFETPVVTLRPFNTYGPRQSARAIIPAIITQILSGRLNIHLGDITPRRDFNYISDTVDGFISALENDLGCGEVVNLGSGTDVSISQLVDMISDILGCKLETVTDKSRLRPKKSEVSRLLADNSKATKMFGWMPKYSGPEGIKRGLFETIEWFKIEKNLAHYKADIYNI